MVGGPDDGLGSTLDAEQSVERAEDSKHLTLGVPGLLGNLGNGGGTRQHPEALDVDVASGGVGRIRAAMARISLVGAAEVLRKAASKASAKAVAGSSSAMAPVAPARKAAAYSPTPTVGMTATIGIWGWSPTKLSMSVRASSLVKRSATATPPRPGRQAERLSSSTVA